MLYSKTKIDWPDFKTLSQMVIDTNFSKVAKKLGVSDNAIRNRFKRHGYEIPKKRTGESYGKSNPT